MYSIPEGKPDGTCPLLPTAADVELSELNLYFNVKN